MESHMLAHGFSTPWSGYFGFTPPSAYLSARSCILFFGPHCMNIILPKMLTTNLRIFPVHTMTPTWVFPAYPLLLNAPFAANLIDAAGSSGYELSANPVAMALGAAAIQGTGCLIAFMISSAFIYRLMTQKLPRDNQRPSIVSLTSYNHTSS
jgi:hypothetical protein